MRLDTCIASASTVSFVSHYNLSLSLSLSSSIVHYSVEVDVNDSNEMIKIIKSAIGTKMISKWSKLACDVALKAVKTVSSEKSGRKEVDIKRYVRMEKVRMIKISFDRSLLVGVACCYRYQVVMLRSRKCWTV